MYNVLVHSYLKLFYTEVGFLNHSWGRRVKWSYSSSSPAGAAGQVVGKTYIIRLNSSEFKNSTSAGPPLAGFIVDATGNLNIAFYISTGYNS